MILLPTPAAIVVGVVGLLLGGVAMAFNPFLLTTVLALVLGAITLQNASRVSDPVGKGLLRIVAIIGVMGGLGGAVIAFAYQG